MLLHRQFRAYRQPGATSCPESAEALFKLSLVLSGLFNFTPSLRTTSLPPRRRDPLRQRLTVHEALKEGPATTWAATAEALAAKPR